jgi:hypothetical protein
MSPFDYALKQYTDDIVFVKSLWDTPAYANTNTT